MIIRHHQNTKYKHRNKGLSIVETLVALSISAMLLTATGVAMDASFYAYASAAESAGTQSSSRLVMQRLLALIRSSTLHDVYDPDNPNAQLGAPANPPVQTVGIQMLTTNEELLKIWWQVNPSYANTYMGDLYYQLGTSTPSIVLGRVEAQAATGGDPYLFSMASISSPDGLLLLRATIDLSVHSDNAALAIETHKGSSGGPVRLVGSTTPRKNID